MCDVSIVIVNWNTNPLLRRCLSSIYESGSSTKANTIVVDNNSNDGSADMVLEEFPHVELIRNQANLGFAKACNQAIRRSTGKHVLLLNSDTEVGDHVLDTMCSFMDENSRVAAIGCRLLNPDGSVQQSYWHLFPSVGDAVLEALYLRRFRFLKRCSKGSQVVGSVNDGAIEVAHLLGACVMLRQEALADVGLFDEDYFMYLEETDWFYRCRQRGWRVCYVPSAEVIHYGQQSSKLDPVRFIPHMSKSYCRFVRKHYGGSTIPLIKAAFMLGSAIRLCLWTKRLLSGPERPLARKMIGAYSVSLCSIARA